MISEKTLDKIKTYEQFEDQMQKMGLRTKIEIGYRGGHLGVNGAQLASYLHVNESDLPGHYGVYCNYLGGGVRGSIANSGYNNDLPEKKKMWLEAFAEMCRRIYEFIENSDGLNDDDEDDPNWDARATKASRRAGIVSAY